MKSGAVSRIDMLDDMMHFARVLESKRGKPFSRAELAESCKMSSSTVNRYLNYFTEHLGLQLDTMRGSSGGSRIVGHWSFVAQVTKRYKSL